MDPDRAEQETAVVHTYEEIAAAIDYPLLAPNLSEAQVRAGCKLAKELGIASVIVRPSDLDLVARWMSGSNVKVGSAVNYPDGCSTTAAKLYEGRDLLRRGAKEIEYSINTGKMISRQFPYMETELIQMAESCAENGASLRILFEPAYFPDDLRLITLKLCKRVGAEFVVANSPLSIPEATYLKQHLGFRLQLKAGVVESLDDLLALREAGCTRFSTRQPQEILEAWRERLKAEAASANLPS